jgi:hypothetical protein
MLMILTKTNHINLLHDLPNSLPVLLSTGLLLYLWINRYKKVLIADILLNFIRILQFTLEGKFMFWN